VSSRDARVIVINDTVSRSVLRYSVINLLPGVCYNCSLRASTIKGFGPATSHKVWTRPDGAFVAHR